MEYVDKSKDPKQYSKGVAKNEFKPRKDLRGLRFGRLYVADFSHKGGKGNHKYYYLCLCDCGAKCIKNSTYLLGKLNPHKSCGCWHKELNIAASTTHGHGNKTYKTWVEMKMRCTNPNNHAYKYYGGRGIKVCERWLNSFANFLADMGERPKEMWLDRIDNNKGYSPDNCRWATVEEQCNNRRSNLIYHYNGKSQTLMQWCKELNINYQNALSFCWKGNRTIENYVNYLKTKKHEKE